MAAWMEWNNAPEYKVIRAEMRKRRGVWKIKMVWFSTIFKKSAIYYFN
jgi:hypothetical protein